MRLDSRGAMQETEVVWIEAPLAVECLRKRHHKPARYVMIKTMAVPAPSFSESEAPEIVVFNTKKAANFEDMPNWLPSIRLADGDFLGPLSATCDKDESHGLKAQIEAHRNTSRPWRDWPFGMPLKNAADKTLEVVSEKDMSAKEWICDVDALVAKESRELATKLVKVGDCLHLRRGRMEMMINVDVRGYGPSKLAPGTVMVRPVLVDEDMWGRPRGIRGRSDEPLACQRFSILRWREGMKFAQRMSRLVGAEVRTPEPPKMTIDPVPFERNDFRTFLADAAKRFAWATANDVGWLDREQAQAWLDLRDLAQDCAENETVLDAFSRRLPAFFFGIRSDPGRGARAMSAILQYDVMRIEFETGATYFADGDGKWRTLAPVDERAYALALS